MRPACVRWRAPWFRWAGCEQVDQSQNGRDGRPPFFCAAKSHFKVTMALARSLSKNQFVEM